MNQIDRKDINKKSLFKGTRSLEFNTRDGILAKMKVIGDKHYSPKVNAWTEIDVGKEYPEKKYQDVLLETTSLIEEEIDYISTLPESKYNGVSIPVEDGGIMCIYDDGKRMYKGSGCVMSLKDSIEPFKEE